MRTHITGTISLTLGEHANRIVAQAVRAALMLLAPLTSLGLAQPTQVHLATQSRQVDFTQFAFTKPVKSGLTLPGNCSAAELFFKTNNTAGTNLYACTSTNNWTLLGFTTGAQITDLLAERSGTDVRVLLVGQSCSVSAPCNVGFGSKTVGISQGATATLTGATAGVGSAFLYVAVDGTLTVGYTAPAGDAITCSGCAAVSGVASFPARSLPLYTWSITWTVAGGNWDALGGISRRAFLSTKTVLAGAGIQVTDIGGESSISVNSSVVATAVSVPATSSSACTVNSWSFDNAFFYLCTAPNTWRRVATSTW